MDAGRKMHLFEINFIHVFEGVDHEYRMHFWICSDPKMPFTDGLLRQFWETVSRKSDQLYVLRIRPPKKSTRKKSINSKQLSNLYDSHW